VLDDLLASPGHDENRYDSAVSVTLPRERAQFQECR
jgi:hypothetical protein